ncbi:putative reverse transcriptase domain-containing protein [Tanacetum coccineum]
MESELWNLTVKNNDLVAYTQRFKELTMMCTKMVPEEEDRVEKFIGGLPDNIQGNIIVAEPTKLQDDVRIANNLMDQKLKGYAMRNAKNKRRLEGRIRGLLRVLSVKHKDINGRITQIEEPKPGNKARVPDARGKAKFHGGGDANRVPTLHRDIPFNKDLMPINLGSISTVIMPAVNWVSKEINAVIVCDEKRRKLLSNIRKQKLCSAPVLALPEGSENFIVYCDASHKGLGAVLMQKEKVIAYAILPNSKTMKNYTTHIWKLGGGDDRSQDVRPLPLTVHEQLSDYDCELRYHPGKTNVVADALSRKSRPKPLRVRALVMTIGLNLPVQILNAQVKARKEENYGTKDLCGMIKNLEPRADGNVVFEE